MTIGMSEYDTEFSEWLEETFRLRGITDQTPPRLYNFLSSESKYFPLAEWRLVQFDHAQKWMDIHPASLTGMVFGARSTQETYDFMLELVMRRSDCGLPPLLVCRSEVGETFDLAFSQLVGDGAWSPVALP